MARRLRLTPAPRAMTGSVRIAALDLGSNSFHLLVVEAHPDGTFETLVREKEVLRLGDVVARTGSLSSTAARSAVDAARRLRALADAAGADDIVACGTAALREAENGADVVDRIDAEAGVRVRVISGKEEARLIFAAVRSSVLIDPAPALCLDLGGGSLEFAVGDAAGLRWSSSLKLGVARLTAEYLAGDRPSAAELRRLRKRIRSRLATVADDIAGFAPQMLVGTSGTLCALARMAAARRTGEVPPSVNQLTVRKKDLAAVSELVLSSRAADRQRIPGVDAKRIDLLPAGATLLMEAFELFGFDELTVSEWALREGMVLDAIGHHDPHEWSDDPRSLRRSSVLALCRRCNWDEAHSRQVAALALDLFDQLQSVHRLHVADRELLEYAALLHDIGEHVSVESHDRHTAYLIEHGRLRGFDPVEVKMLTAIGRFHRRGTPKSAFPAYDALTPRARGRVDRLVAVLRIADGLDRSRTGAVGGLAVRMTARSVRLAVVAVDDVDLELWGLRRKRELFEKVFGVSLDVTTATSAESRPA